MSTDYYDFETKLKDGNDGEDNLVEYYRHWFKIFPVGKNEQRHGMDFYFENISSGRQYSVEIKTDYRAAESKNIFIETISVDNQDKKGWAYTCCAQLIFIYVPDPVFKVYRVRTLTIKTHIEDWKKKYDQTPPIRNNGYNTFGILIPIVDFEKYCYKIDDVANFFSHRRSIGGNLSQK